MTALAWAVIVALGLPIAVALVWVFFDLLSEDWAFVGILAAVCTVALALTWASHQVGAW